MARNRCLGLAALPFGACLHSEEVGPHPQLAHMLPTTVKGLLLQRSDVPDRTLGLELSRTGGPWIMDAGRAPSYNQRDHLAVTTQEDGKNIARLFIQEDIADSDWISKGEATIAIEWNGEEGEHYQGHYHDTALSEELVESAIGHGLLYILQADTTYADRARAAVELHMVDIDGDDKDIDNILWGFRLEQVAIT